MKILKPLISVIVCISMLMLTGCGGKKPTGNSSKSVNSVTSSKENESTDVQSNEEESVYSEPVSENTDTEEPKKMLDGKINLKLQPLPGGDSYILLTNPDRGFRLETYYTLHNEVAYPSSNQDAFSFFDNLYYDYYEDYPQLSQAFFYITEWYNKDLDSSVFEKLDKYFEYMREKKMRLLIRFVYQWDEKDRVKGPTPAQILRHIEQLKPTIEKNADVIHCWQAGFLGNWGEWHNLIHEASDNDKANILKALVNNSPSNMFIQTRMVEYRNTVSDSDVEKNRIGFHDDYLTGFAQRWSCGLTEGTADYQQMINASSNVLVDGEMPWGDDKQMGEKFDGLKMAKYLSLRHFTSMSLIHNYRDSGICTMSYWKEQYVNEKTLKSNGLRVAPGWYQKEDGTAHSNTVFDYIQQYMGYYIVASNASVNTSASSVSASLTLKNYGFAAPLAMDKIELVLLDSENEIVGRTSGGNMSEYQPGKAVTLSGKFSIPKKDEEYSLGIRFVNSAGTGARLANICEFENNINVLGRVR